MMARVAARIDANQPEVVDALRTDGCTVLSLAAIGKGCPDLMVGKRGINALFEVKDGSKPPSAQRLSKDQIAWVKAWQGHVCVVRSAEEAVSVMRGLVGDE